MSNEAEDSPFWDKIYEQREIQPFNDKDFRNAATLDFVERINIMIKPAMKVLEVGGAGGQLSCHLAKKHPLSSFSILDFSKKGCFKAERLAEKEKVNIEVHNLDFFSCAPYLESKFEFLFSLGVVEHFPDLSFTIKKLGFYLKEKGLIFTLIPNMASPVYSYLCKKWNKKVLEVHILYNLDDLCQAHKEAGFKVLDSGYIYPLEFSILSIAFLGKTQKGAKWYSFLWLTRISKIVHLLTKIGLKLPASRLFSPYIFVLGEKIS